jgi:SAM-dependent methyltransferase
MIPFNRLGLLFRLFSPWIYPRKAIDDLSELLQGVGSGDLVLDIGAGAGVLTRFAHSSRHDLSYTTLDPAYGMLRHGPHYARKIRARAESLPFDRNVFGLVLIGDTIHHIQNPHEALLEIRRCMVSGGRLFIFDFNPDTFMGRGICGMERLFKEPANFYSPETLSDMLMECGFEATINKYDWRYSVTAEWSPLSLGKIQPGNSGCGEFPPEDPASS